MAGKALVRDSAVPPLNEAYRDDDTGIIWGEVINYPANWYDAEKYCREIAKFYPGVRLPSSKKYENLIIKFGNNHPLFFSKEYSTKGVQAYEKLYSFRFIEGFNPFLAKNENWSDVPNDLWTNYKRPNVGSSDYAETVTNIKGGRNYKLRQDRTVDDGFKYVYTTSEHFFQCVAAPKS